MTRHHRGLTILALVVVAVGIASVASSHNKTSSSLPSGEWGRVIHCLESHPLLSVFDAESTTGGRPGPGTRAVAVLQDVKGTTLAYIGNDARGADNVTGARDANVNLRDGGVRYGFTSRASARNRVDIQGCIWSP